MYLLSIANICDFIILVVALYLDDDEYEPAYFEETRRGFQKLIHDGYAYTMDRKSMKTSNWKCAVFTR